MKNAKFTYKLSSFLILVVLTSSIYIFMPDKVKLVVENTRSKFYVWEDAWILSATEYMYLYDGTAKMRAKEREVTFTTQGDLTKIMRVARYKDNITTIQLYEFRSDLNDIELFPVKETAACINCEGKIVHFEYRDLAYNGITRNANSPELFGHNMKIEWQTGYYRAKLYQQKVASDKLIIRYRPSSDYVIYSIRMFDPTVNLYLDSVSNNRSYEFQTTAQLNATSSSGTVCIDIDDASGTEINVSCGSTETNYNYTIDLLREDKFNDNTTNKNLTSSGNITITMDNRTDLINTSINLTGYGATSFISTFTTGSMPDNITYTGAENVTRYINISSGSNITSATIDLRGYGKLINVSSINDRGNAADTFSNGTYIYAAQGTGGLSAYTFDGTTFTEIDYAEGSSAYYGRGVWSDGTYVYYTGGSSEGIIIAYTFNGTDFTYKSNVTAPTANIIWRVRGDGTNIIAAADVDGIIAYTFDGATFTQVANYTTTSARETCVNESDVTTGYIHLADNTGRIKAFTFDGATFTYITVSSATGAKNIDCDDNYIYVAAYSQGLKAYTFNGTDYTEVANVDPSNGWGVAVKDNYVLISTESGIYAYYFNGSNFNFQDTLLSGEFVGDIDFFDINPDYFYAAADASEGTVAITFTLPTNVTIDTANDTILDYTNYSIFNGSVSNIDLNITAMNNWITSNCPSGWCSLPIIFSSATAGILQYSNLEIYPSFPSNIIINTYNQIQAVLPGTLIGNLFTQNTFSYSSTDYTAYNLSFASASSKNIFFNITTSPINNTENKTILKNGMNNLTFQIYGSEVDVGNDLDDTNYFNLINQTINLTTGKRRAMYDNFENLFTNTSDRWVQTITGDWTDNNDGFTTGQSDNYYLMDNTKSDSACDNQRCDDTSALEEQELDYRNISFTNVRWDIDCTTTVNGAGGGASNKIRLSDGTNTIVLFSEGCTGDNTESYTENLTFLRSETNATNWEIYRNGTNTENSSSASLDTSQPWRLQFYGDCHYEHWPQAGGDAGSSCSATMKVYYIELGALGLNRTNITAQAYNNETLITSDIVFTAPNNITAAYINPVTSVPASTTVTYFLSNDNATTWQEAESGLRETFSSTGNQLRWRVNFTTTDGNYSPFVFYLNLQIIPGTAENVSIDLGNDGTTDYTYTGVLNSTNSPVNITIEPDDAVDYVDNFCSIDKTCNVPIKVTTGTAGLVEIKTFNWSQNPNPIYLNKSLFETCEECSININFTNGIVEINDVRFDFFGSKNITVLAHNTNYSVNKSFVIQVKYSNFNISSPVDYWDFIPDWQNDTYVESFGQEANNNVPIFNFTSLAYDQPIDLFFRFNESPDSCITQFCDLNGNQTNASLILTNSTTNITASLSENNQVLLYCWANYTDCNTSLVLDDPYSYFFSMCNGCVKTYDWEEPS